MRFFRRVSKNAIVHGGRLNSGLNLLAKLTHVDALDAREETVGPAPSRLELGPFEQSPLPRAGASPTIVSMSAYFGRQFSVASNRALPATSSGGSPARRPSITRLIGEPLARSTASSTSRTERPLP